MNVAVIGDADTTVGFKLSGITDAYEAKSTDITRVWDEIMRKDYKLIIITENLAAFIKKQIGELEGETTPIIVEIPDKKGPTGYSKESLKDTIRKAVGIDISAKDIGAKK